MRIFLSILVLFVATSMTAFAQDSPFTNQKPPEQTAPASTENSTNPDQNATQWLLHWQKQFHEGLTKTIRSVKESRWSWEVLFLIGFSFLYGILHTLLPGHQKAVIGSYFLSENARYGQGFLAGILFAVFHALSAILVLLFFRFVLHLSAGGSVQQASFWAQLIASLGVMALGFGMFLYKLRGLGELKRKAELNRVRQMMGFDLHDRIESSYEPIPWKKFLPFLFFAAILPCPGTLFVIFFALSLGVFEFGVISVLSISLGMAVTLVAIALFVIWMKKRSQARVYRTPGHVTVFAIESLGLLAIVGFSLFWLLLGQSS